MRCRHPFGCTNKWTEEYTEVLDGFILCFESNSRLKARKCFLIASISDIVAINSKVFEARFADSLRKPVIWRCETAAEAERWRLTILQCKTDLSQVKIDSVKKASEKSVRFEDEVDSSKDSGDSDLYDNKHIAMRSDDHGPSFSIIEVIPIVPTKMSRAEATSRLVSSFEERKNSLVVAALKAFKNNAFVDYPAKAVIIKKFIVFRHREICEKTLTDVLARSKRKDLSGGFTILIRLELSYQCRSKLAILSRLRHLTNEKEQSSTLNIASQLVKMNETHLDEIDRKTMLTGFSTASRFVKNHLRSHFNSLLKTNHIQATTSPRLSAQDLVKNVLTFKFNNPFARNSSN